MNELHVLVRYVGDGSVVISVTMADGDIIYRRFYLDGGPHGDGFA